MKKKSSIITILTLFFYLVSCLPVRVSAEVQTPVKAYIRVEGISGTIAEGYSEGVTVMDLFENLLKSKGISYDIQDGTYGKELITVAGQTKKAFGRTDGWMYYYKSPSIIDLLPGVFDQYNVKSDESYIFFYGEWEKTPFVNSITFTPEIVKENSSFKIKFAWKYFDWYTNVEVENPIVNAIVTIDNQNYITDSKGEIEVQPLELGEHTYKISGYQIKDVPSVVMDKGIFVIDNEHSPSITFDPQKYDDLDNSKVMKDIDKEVKAITDFLTSNSDNPWTALTLAKQGIKGGESYIKEMAEFIPEYGLENISNTDLEKLILNLTALGYDPYNFIEKDLVKELFNRDLNNFLINDTIFALLVHHNLQVKNQYNITEAKLVDNILKNTLKYDLNGVEVTGWALSGDTLNPDITGAALSALAPYNDSDHPEVMTAVENAVNSLSILQNESGYLADNFGMFSESLSFVITGLTAVGENPEGTKFTKLKGDLVAALLSFKDSEGQFKHSLQGGKDYIATEQALRALYSLAEYKKTGKYNFYDSNVDSTTLKEYNFVEEQEQLPQTGSALDFNTMIFMASLLCIAGAVMASKKVKNNN